MTREREREREEGEMAHFAGDCGGEQPQEVPEQRTVEVGDPVPVAGQRNSGLGHFVGLERKKKRFSYSS
jgi:hypothetical protein